MTALRPDSTDTPAPVDSIPQQPSPSCGPGEASGAEIAGMFDRLDKLGAALPLTTDEYCFVSNWLGSARALWTLGEWGACRYQLAIIRKKLGAVPPADADIFARLFDTLGRPRTERILGHPIVRASDQR